MPKIKQYITVITINVNGLNSPIKRNRLAQWIKKQCPTIFYLQETHLTQKEIHRLKVQGWKTILHASRIQKKLEGSDAVCRQCELQTKKGLKR